MAFLSESKLARYTERLWANISAKFAAKEDLANLDVQDEIYIGTGEMPEGYVLQINPEGEVVNLSGLPVPEEDDAGKVVVVDDEGKYVLGEAGSAEAKNAVLYTAQTLTSAQKTQAKSNLGLATVASSGSYNDLTNKPTIPSAVVVDSTLSQVGAAADAKAVGDALKVEVIDLAEIDPNMFQSAPTWQGELNESQAARFRSLKNGQTIAVSLGGTPIVGIVNVINDLGIFFNSTVSLGYDLYWGFQFENNSLMVSLYGRPTINLNGNTLDSKVRANPSDAATLSSAQLRDIVASTTDLTAGTSTLAAGTVYLVYE